MQLVMVVRSFDEPMVFEELQAREKAGQWCLDMHEVEFVKTYFSADRRQMFCLYRAPDVEAVRSAQRKADMPFDRIFAVSERS